MIRNAFISVLLFAETLKAEDGKGGMPQLNPESFSSQIFWLVLLFLILFVLIHFFFLPKIENIRKKRDETIDNYLSEAKKINDSINQIISRINKDFEQAKNKQSDELRQNFEANKQILDKKVLEINSEFEKKKIQLNNDIESNRKSIISNIPRECVKISDILYEKIMGEKKKGDIDEFRKIIGD